MPLMIGMMFAIIGSTTPHEDITGRVEELQSWAEKRYVLNLTEEQAEKLIELSDNTKSEKSIESVKVTDAYGDKLNLILSGKDTSWKLVDITQEIKNTGYSQ
jgi:hypothetical protein